MAIWRFALFIAMILAGSPLLLAAQEISSPADDYGPKKFTCLVDGEQFEQNVSWIGYPLEARPDGGTLGSEFTDMMVPECPGNGLVMVPKHDGEAEDPQAFAPYSDAEIARLPALVASPEYQALRKEARFYRLYWIAQKLDRPAIQRLHLLQHISFIKVPHEQQRRYLEFFVAETDALLAHGELDAMTKLRFQYYTANALRQLGQFDEARARVAKVDSGARALQEKKLSQTPRNQHFEDEYEFEDEDGLVSVTGGQLKAIEAGDTDRYPVSMMGDRVANSICRDVDDSYPPATEMTKRGCDKRRVEESEAEKQRQAAFDKRQALEGDPANLAKLCVATATEKRDEPLEEACDFLQRQDERKRRGAEAAKLLKNPKALDVQCKNVSVPGRYAQPRTALGEACQKRQAVLHDEKQIEYAARFEKDPALIDKLCTMEYPQLVADDPLEEACASAESSRSTDAFMAESDAIKALSKAEIASRCAATPDRDKRSNTLHFACVDLESDKEDAERKDWEANPAKLAQACLTSEKVQFSGTVLEGLCYRREEARVDGAAIELARDHAKLVANCNTTPQPQRDEVLAMACSRYRKCVIVRFDELPYDQGNGFYYLEEKPNPARPTPACYDTPEEASAAVAQYAADPKSLRANSCKSNVDAARHEVIREQCEAYARGEDVFTDAGDNASSPGRTQNP